jgi:dTDP-4-amino-4,6-dideoxygalactose transaminase
MGFGEGNYPEAEKYYFEAVSLPLFSSMTDLQQEEVVSVIKLALNTLSIEDD